ncbi:MAG TPA: DUF456 domain-containing protein [Gemmatimonadaceae bacterium]|nr:DUF456 domain-containing protein [Gemmatimonadaceae bacterium]
MSILLLALALFLSLLLIPLGLPGTWLMVICGLIYSYAVPHTGIGAVAIIGCVVIAFVAELLDIAMSGRYTRKYGGSRRGVWGAIIGGMIGAIVGVPVPVIGSVIGAFIGSFAGALVGEYSRGATHDVAARAASGAAIGRAMAMGLKAGAGCVIAAWLMAAAVF